MLDEDHSCLKRLCCYVAVTCMPMLSLCAAAGQEEVESAVRMLDEEARRLARSRLQYKLMAAPMYAGAC